MVANTKQCNICGGIIFSKGPGGRLSFYQELPYCTNCGSLERHRVFRNIWNRIREQIDLESKKVLQISEDGSVPNEWFESLEISVYGSFNSIDIQNINRNDNFYDIVICNHVLEHVKDTIKALQELMRIIKDTGFLQLSVPDPFRILKTLDWGYPKEEDHGHYRIYGKDIIELFHEALPGIYLLTIIGIDDVTNSEDVCFIFSRNFNIRYLYPNLNMKHFQKLGDRQFDIKSFQGMIPLAYKNNENLVCRNFRLFFWPDYTITNPYQNLLVDSLQMPIISAAGNIDDALKALMLYSEDQIVFHLHWTGPLINQLNNDEVNFELNNFIQKLYQFKRYGGKIIWTIHNLFQHESEDFNKELLLHRLLSKIVDIIHIHSFEVVALAEQYFQIPIEKIIVAPHGNYIDSYPNTISRDEAKKELNLPINSRIFLFFGQIRVYKGIENLIDAFIELSEKNSDLHLLLVGDSSLMSKDSFIKRINKSRNIHLFLEFIKDEDVQKFFKASDIIVLPYKNVLTSGSALLALSFGIPIIAPNIGLLKSIVDHGYNGWIYNSLNEQSLREILYEVSVVDENKLLNLKVNSLEKAKTFDWKSTGKIISEAILSLNYGKLLNIELNDESNKYLVRLSSNHNGRTAVIVVHYNNIQDSINCINDLSKLSDLSNIYLVSNDEDLVAYLSFCEKYNDLNVIQSGRNIGYAAANNLAISLIKQINYEFIWLVNPDMIVEDKFTIKKFEAAADLFDDYDIFGSIVTFADRPDTIWFGGGEVHYKDGFRVCHSYMGNHIDDTPKLPWETTYITGANMFVRSNLFEKVGFLPEEFFLYFEETQWCLKAKEIGFKLLVLPDIILSHHKRSEDNGIPTLTYLYYFTRNWLLMANIWNPKQIEVALEQISILSEQWFKTIANKKPGQLILSEKIYKIGLEDGLKKIIGYKNLREIIDENK